MIRHNGCALQAELSDPELYDRIRLFVAKIFGLRLVWLIHHDGEENLRLVRKCRVCRGDFVHVYGTVATAHLDMDGRLLEGPGYVDGWREA